MAEHIVIREKTCKTALSKSGIPGFEYCMNPYVGCAHDCAYCYATFMCRFAGHSERWGEFVDVKVNFPEALRKQLSGRSKPKGRVLLGTVTDAYQPAEARFRITRESLEILAEYGLLEPNILTKSALVLRDLPILKKIKGAKVGFTITTMDRKVARVFEPGASPPQVRLTAARQLMKAGIPVWVFIAPVLPGLSDTEEALRELFRALRETGIEEIMTDFLNPYPTVVSRMKAAYRRHFPAALPKLEEYLRNPAAYRDIIEDRIERVRSGI
ncbi:MAG: Radical domain protein [Firmicutes bacterium]|nr:Radical domain protein [Bacillota bacterium]